MDRDSNRESELVAEQQLQAEMLWQELVVGDEVLVEFPVYEGGANQGATALLTPGRGYLILEKRMTASQIPQFITESNLPGYPVVVYPHCICSYRRADDSTIH